MQETKLLYMDDSYLRKFTARVIDVLENQVVLDRTAFYPRGGGLVSDKGVIRHDDCEYVVYHVEKRGGVVYHFVSGQIAFSAGSLVEGEIDWQRRYRLMRMHTGLHVLGALFYEKMNALVTGNQVEPERSRVDLSLEEFKREIVEEVFEEANKIISKGIEVKTYYLPREEALKIPGIVKLANAMPPEVKMLRIVEIPGVDIQADGGPHVANTKEVGRLALLKTESKGRRNKRIYFTVEP